MLNERNATIDNTFKEAGVTAASPSALYIWMQPARWRFAWYPSRLSPSKKTGLREGPK
jgi:hypothetical protein